MLTIRSLRERTEELAARLSRKGVDGPGLVQEALRADERLREQIAVDERDKAQINEVSRQIGELMRRGDSDGAATLRAEVARVKERVRARAEEIAELERTLSDVMVRIPNAPHESVPDGRGAEDNQVVRTWGEIPQLGPDALPHWEIAERLGIIDFARGTRISGSGFPLFRGAGALLQRALINFFLEENVRAGYEEMLPPILVSQESAYGTGNLPDKEGQMYHAPLDGLFLVPTAEVPLTNVVRGEVLEEEALPVRMTAYTPCFRREAGSYGKDVRGLNRLHQFDKVEIVCVEKPERSYDRLEEMVQHVEHLLQALGLPYRVLRLCAGDMSFSSAMTYDLEVYSAAQGRWLEVSSVSNFEEFQANRLQARYRDRGQKRPVLLHTLNGSALALPRVMAALLENNQRGGGVDLPAALAPWLRGLSRLQW